jgi:hypothetical protein
MQLLDLAIDYSHGMQKKLALAAAIAVCDAPTGAEFWLFL